MGLRDLFRRFVSIFIMPDPQAPQQRRDTFYSFFFSPDARYPPRASLILDFIDVGDFHVPEVEAPYHELLVAQIIRDDQKCYVKIDRTIPEVDAKPLTEDEIKMIKLCPEIVNSIEATSEQNTSTGNIPNDSKGNALASISNLKNSLIPNNKARALDRLTPFSDYNTAVGKSEKLATLTFEPAFSFTQLILITKAVSDSAPRYHLFISQCYCFALSVWEVC
jgi:hypothetical protein